ncbi:MAG TPA: hypothetical protein VGE79_12365, partial [Niastella sp.]
DRYTEKYASFSGYQYALNNPVINIDINGDSTWTTTRTIKTKDGNTITTNTLHIRGKVLDLAGVKTGGGCNCRNAAGDLVEGINDDLNKNKSTNVKNGNTETWNVDAQFTLAKSMDEVSSSDHLVVVVDDVTGQADPALGGGEAGGVAEQKGKIAYVENTTNIAFLIQNSVHEIGHTMGLIHTENGTGNYMNYDQVRWKFSPLQLLTMYNMSKNGALNKGSNSQRSVQRSNNWFFHTSTNDEPYRKNTKVGERIPFMLKND